MSVYSGNSCTLAQLHSINKVTWLLGAVTHNHSFELQALNPSVPPVNSNHSLQLSEKRWWMPLLAPSSAHQEQQLKVGTDSWSSYQKSQTSRNFFAALKRLLDCSHTLVLLLVSVFCILCLSRHSKQLCFPVLGLPFTLLLILLLSFTTSLISMVPHNLSRLSTCMTRPQAAMLTNAPEGSARYHLLCTTT